jgi:hypothetical protein
MVRRIKKILFIFIFISFIIVDLSIVYGAEIDDIENKAYDLGYEDGKAESLKYSKDTPYYEIMPKDDEIISRFESEYRESISTDSKFTIIKCYEYGFKKGYEQNVRDDKNKKEEKISYPKSLGKALGEIYGHRDFYNGEKSNWGRVIPSDRELIKMYNLDMETSGYRYNFLKAFKGKFEEGYKDGYENANLKTIKASYEQGVKDGETFGVKLGSIYGAKDYFEGRTLEYNRNLPPENTIEREYLLNDDVDEYREGFLIGFKRAYEESYNEAYREANRKSIEVPDSKGRDNGITIGKMKGEYAAIIDITIGKSNLWTRHKNMDSFIIDEYGLDFQSENYRESFINGYWDGFMESYNEVYKKLQLDSNKVKTYTEKITIDGKENIGIPNDDKFLVDIEAGTYYNDVIITIDSIPTFYVNPNSNRHTQASGVYGLKIMNLAGTFDKDKKVTIKFKSYGNNVKYGIYKYHYNKWVYIPSTQKGDYLVADINLNNIDALGNIYAVRIDNQLPIFYDSRGHWAKEEINTYVKREIINGYPDGTFRPNEEITRREFITMLSRLYDWYPPYDSSNVKEFKDYKEFGYSEKAISYAIYHNIVNGYSDNTFRPHNPITYKEVEIIMAKVLDNKNFNWDYYAKKMLYEEGVRSKSMNSKNNKITRGEFVYMLNRLNEWQY